METWAYIFLVNFTYFYMKEYSPFNVLYGGIIMGIGKQIIIRGIAYAAGTILGIVLVNGLKKIIIEDYKNKLTANSAIKDINASTYQILDKDGNVIYEGDMKEIMNGTKVTMEDLNKNKEETTV